MSFFFFSTADKTLLNVAYLKLDQRTGRDVSRIPVVQGAALSISISLELILAFPIPLVGVMACDALCSFLSFRLNSLTVL